MRSNENKLGFCKWCGRRVRTTRVLAGTPDNWWHHPNSEGGGELLCHPDSKMSSPLASPVDEGCVSVMNERTL